MDRLYRAGLTRVKKGFKKNIWKKGKVGQVGKSVSIWWMEGELQYRGLKGGTERQTL